MAVYQGARPRGPGAARALITGASGLARGAVVYPAAGYPAAGRVAAGPLRGRPSAGTRAAGVAARPGLLGAAAGPIARRPRRVAIRAGRPSAAVGFVLAAILVVFVLAFVSLAQTVRVSASNYEIDRMMVQQERLQERQRELQSDINRLGSEPAIRKLAFDAGLGQLQAPVVLPAR